MPPSLKGFSSSNVSRMRAFFLAYTRTDVNSAPAMPNLDSPIFPQPVGKTAKRQVARRAGQMASAKIPQAVGQIKSTAVPQPFGDIPWGHNAVLIEKVKGLNARRWYAFKSIEHGWSRAVLTVQIETNLFARQGKAVTNFAATLAGWHLPEPSTPS